MFTGLIEEVGRVGQIRRTARAAKLYIEAATVIADAAIGDSIAVSGVCLTVTDKVHGGFVADAVAETLERSTLHDLSAGDAVNLERAMRASARFGGHFVAGHVDGIGHLKNVWPDGAGYVLEVSVSPSLTHYIVEKGSIAVDGVSLTVMDVGTDRFRVSLIPHSAHASTLGTPRAGRAVNIEVDLLAKYVEKLIGKDDRSPSLPDSLSESKLRGWGY